MSSSLPDVDFDNLHNLLGYHLRRAQVAVFKDFEAAVGSESITPGLLGALTIIGANEGLSQNMLADALALDRSTLVSVIDKLEARQLVKREKSPQDRRRHALFLTNDGREVLARTKQKVVEHEKKISQGMSPEERAKLIDLLRGLYK
ncbi:MAG: MarR family transcriptional regulator [Rhodospirillales bacterium]|nr:MarR family transcriptional regulator [Rhodospirillales bacterium]